MKNLILTLLCLGGMAHASAQNLQGSYSLVSIENIYPDGKRVYPYGDAPSGLLSLEESGTYAIQILSTDRPEISSDDKNKLTRDEYASIVKGFNSHYGRYQLNNTEKSITFTIDHASYPEWENTVQKRSFTFFNEELKYVVTRTTQGGESVIAEVIWRKR